MKKTLLLSTTLLMANASVALAADGSVPTLTVTNKPIAQVLKQTSAPVVNKAPSKIDMNDLVDVSAVADTPSYSKNLYSKPVRADEIKANRVLGGDYFEPVNTMTAKKIVEIQNEMYGLQTQIADASDQLKTLETVGQDLAANYYAAIATINTQLQSGTTPGNPRLKGRLTLAEDALDTLSGNVADLNIVAVKIADLASVSNFLQQQARSAYGLSGSVEEDHVALAQLEDELANTAVAIERLLNSVNDNITRAAAYMATERANLRTLSLAVANGDLYGKSLANRPFSMAGSTDVMEKANFAPSAQAGVPPMPNTMMPMKTGVLANPRPLMKIRFDRPDVDYSQALYMSVNDAMQQYPNSRFELVAVSPGMGNPAKLAIESTKARRNAEKVLRNMVQMGVNSNKVDLANLTQDELQYNEVHLYIR